jgi:hypothetical protein
MEGMIAEVLINRNKNGLIEVSVLRKGMSSGAVQTYPTTEEAKATLAALGFPEALINERIRALWQAPVDGLLRFPESEIQDEILRSHGFKAA